VSAGGTGHDAVRAQIDAASTALLADAEWSRWAR
jgi:hypothetical protein